MQSISAYKYEFYMNTLGNLSRLVLELKNPGLYSQLDKPITMEEALNYCYKYNFTIPDSFMIAIILCVLVNQTLIRSTYLTHINGCKFGKFFNSEMTLIDKYTFDRKVEGLSYKIVKYSDNKIMPVYTCNFKLDKKIWTKQYKKDIIALWKLKGYL